MLALLLLSAAGVSPAWAGKKEKKAAVSTAAPAILAGTVFSGAGFALRGAEVVVTRADLAGAKPSAKAAIPPQPLP